MRLQVIMKIMGVLLSLFSISLLPPTAVAVLSADGTQTPFLFAFIVTLVTGFVFWFATRHRQEDL